MPSRIEVTLKPHFQDAYGIKITRRCREDLHLEVSGTRTIKAYLIDSDLTEKQLETLARDLFSDPVTQVTAVNCPLARELGYPWDWLIEVGFRPGVTDNEGRIAGRGLELFLGHRLGTGEDIYTSTQYCIQGKLTRDQVEIIARGLLANGLIQRITVVSKDELSRLWSEKENPFY
ncbi:MAG: phosphoribosylformylglycinamidine synthase, partial [Nitrospiraceae bacterium]|nr:phosphoribosylformylglycinamidine synthase [Nitrospiraceae bacterium]